MDFIDANVFWNWMKGGRCTSFFEEIASGSMPVCTSFHVLAEMHMALLGQGYGREDVLTGLNAVLNIPNLEFVETTPQIFQRALQIDLDSRGLGIFDSLHAATCLENGFRLATFDKHFSRVKGLKTLKPSLL